MANSNNKKDFATNPDYWFDEASQTINLLNDVENALFHDISSIIDEKLNAIFYKLALIVILSTIVIIALISITLNFVKNILASTTKLNEEFSNSQSLLEQYKSSVDRSFIVSKTDKHGIITYVNDEFCKISGYSRDELLGKSHNIIRHPDVDAEVFKELWHTIKDKKEPWFGEIQNRAKDKTVYWTKAIINPILDSNQNIIEYIGIRTDVTELENAMIAALSAEKAKSLFLATMSHELRTPLNAVIGFSQILMAKSDMPQENIRLFVEKIHASGKHLLNIVNNILDFSKIESGKIELNKKDISLEDLVKDTILLLENEALKKEIKITTDYFSNITINYDEQLLKQVILNILSNAIKFSNQNSTVALSYEEDEKNHIIKICDSGIGLSQEQIEKLFLPFSQIQEHQNSAIKGTGLGLVISQKIAKLHNGVIEVTSQEAKGSCFYIKLPITKAQNE
jgi:PAS domain S-box-containing protein